MVRGKKTVGEERERVRRIYEALEGHYPEVRCTLEHRGPFELLIMTILAAQCTDARVNIVAQDLFRRFPNPASFAKASIPELEEAIHSTGFYHSKAKNISAASTMIIEQYRGEIPGTMEDLLRLPGVGRKTANVILGDCFGTPGVVVDTHCGRLARRMGFTQKTEPAQVEKDLMRLWPQEIWTKFSHLMVFHGRATCASRAPKCQNCVALKDCPWPSSPEGKRHAQ